MLRFAVLSLALAASAHIAIAGTISRVGHLVYTSEPTSRIVLSTDEGKTLTLMPGRSRASLASLARRLGPEASVLVTGTAIGKDRLVVETVKDVRGELIKDYFPCKKGHIWYFKDSATNEEFNINIQGNQTIHGVSTWEFQRTRTGMAHDFDLIALDATGAYLHKRFVRGNTIDLVPAARFCEGELVVGKIYTTQPAMVNPATGNTTIWTAKVEKFENVTVPAGTFPAVKISLLIKDSKLGSKLAEVSMWYAKNVGVVQRQGQFFGVFLVEKLLRYTLVP